MNILSEVRKLREEGKLHGRLLTRLRILFGISLILTVIVVFNVISRGTSLYACAFLAIFGFILGMYLFSRMSAVNWNEEESVVQAERMDKIGFAVLVLYIIFEIGLRVFLRDFFPASATIFILAGVSGTLLGRALGMMFEIHAVYRGSHAD